MSFIKIIPSPFITLESFQITIHSSTLHFSLFSAYTFLNLMETVELKVEMVGIHEKRLRKCLSKLKGIEKVEVDGNSDKVTVTGYAHRNKILKAVRRGGLRADFWSPQYELLNAYACSTTPAFRFNSLTLF